jgi:hypothetical protein
MLVRFFVLMLSLMLWLGMPSQAQNIKQWRTNKASEVRMWFLANAKQIHMLGSEPLFPEFMDDVVSMTLQKRSVVKIITGSNAIERFKRLALAGAGVRYRVGAFQSQNGFSSSVVILENRYVLSKRGNEWQLFDSIEGAGQVLRQFNLLWDYCSPIPTK